MAGRAEEEPQLKTRTFPQMRLIALLDLRKENAFPDQCFKSFGVVVLLAAQDVSLYSFRGISSSTPPCTHIILLIQLCHFCFLSSSSSFPCAKSTSSQYFRFSSFQNGHSKATRDFSACHQLAYIFNEHRLLLQSTDKSQPI